jgi:hypothetical protein
MKCDICRKLISIYHPLHRCEPSLADFIRLIPNYATMQTDEQARWVQSTLHLLNRQHKPEWLSEHEAVIKQLILKFGNHLVR